MITWPRRRRHEALAALVLLLRRGEALAAGLSDLSQDDPDLRRLCAGLVARLQRGEDLGRALVAERLLRPDEAATLGEYPGGALERLTGRLAAERAGARLLRWYPLWLAAWWLLPGLVLTVVVEAVARHPFALLTLRQTCLSPGLALTAGLGLGFWLIVSCLLNHRWGQPLAMLLMPGARRALLARRLLDQAAAGPVSTSWWRERRLWHASGFEKAATAADPLAALVADHLLVLGTDGRPDWPQSFQRCDEEVRSRLGPARAVLIFGLVLAALGGFAQFLGLQNLSDSALLGLSGESMLGLGALLGGLVLVQLPLALGRRLLNGWSWNPAWPRVASQLATALERREDGLVAIGGCRPILPFGLRSRLDAACLELSAGQGHSLMTVLGRAGIINAAQRQSALAAEQAGSEALIAWLRQEGAVSAASSAAATQLQVQLLLFLFISSYLATFVLPKFSIMLSSLGLGAEAPWSLNLIRSVCSSWWPWLILGGLTVAGVISRRQGWWQGQREERRLQRGELLVRGLASGRSEADLAATLAWTWRTPPSGLDSAAWRGDWGKLLTLAGWGACTPATLAEAVDLDRLRHGRSRARVIALSLVLVPILTALPVGLTLHSVMASIAVINRHAMAMAQSDPGGSARYLGAVINGPHPVMIVPYMRQPLPLDGGAAP